MERAGKISSPEVNTSDAFYDFACAPCSDDGGNTEAMFYCIDCKIFYCRGCVTGHNKFTKNHTVVDQMSALFGQDQKKFMSNSSNELPTDFCEEHNGQVIQMFCGQQDVVCCIICIAVKHRSCEGVEYIPNIVRGLLQKQDKGIVKASLERVKDDLQNLKSKMQEQLQELHKQRDDILADIETLRKRLIDRVEELEKNSVKEVQDTHCRIAADIYACRKKIDGMITDVQLRLDKLKYSETDNEAQTFVDIKDGEKQVSDGNQCVKRYISTKFENFGFDVNREIEAWLNEAWSLGTVWTEEIFLDGLSMHDFPEQNQLPHQIQQHSNSLTSPISYYPYGQQSYFGVNSNSSAHSQYTGCPPPPFSFHPPRLASNNVFGITPKTVSSTINSPSGPVFGSSSASHASRSNIFGTPVASSGSFGISATANMPFGQSPATSNCFVTPGATNTQFGTTAALFGTQGTANNSRGIQGAANSSFGTSDAANSPFGPWLPVTQTSRFGMPGDANRPLGMDQQWM